MKQINYKTTKNFGENDHLVYDEKNNNAENKLS